MTRAGIILLAFLTPIALIAAGEAIPLEDGFGFTWSPALDSSRVGADDMLLLNFPGAQFRGDTGTPAIPRLVRSVVLPPGGEFEFEIMETTWSAPERCDLAPMPAWRGFPDGPFYPEYRKDREIYSENRRFPVEDIIMTDAGFSRRVRLGEISIPAARYNPASRRLQILERIRLRVTFSRAETRGGGVPDPLEKAVISAALNPDAAAEFLAPQSRRRVDESIFSRSENWFSFPVTGTGLQVIDDDFLELLGFSPASVDPSEIRLFDNGWGELETEVGTSLPELEEIPLYAVGTGDGSLDPGDGLYFLARGPSGGYYSGGDYRYQMHRFSFENRYWITVGGDFSEPGARLSSENPPAVDAPPLETGIVYHHVEDDGVYAKTGNSIEWGWERTESKHVTFLDSRLVPEDTVYFRHRLVPVDGESRPLTQPTVNGEEPALYSTPASGAWQSIFVGSFTDGSNSIDIEFEGVNVLFDYYEIIYSAELAERNGYLDFYGAKEPANYRLTGFSEEPLVFDITDYPGHRLLELREVSGGYEFTDTLGASSLSGGPRHFYIVPLSEANRASFPTAEELTGLRELTLNCDELLIIPEGLEGDLSEYISFRESRGTEVEWVFVEDVLKEFGFGADDPTAIRDYLRFLWENEDSPPEYVMLIGDATWDPRGITDPPETYCPAALCVANAPDDYFISVTPGDRIPDYASGRVPITTINDWRHWVSKLVEFEGNPDYGPWRTRFVFTADDERKTGDTPDSWQHTTQTSSYAQSMPKWAELRMVYLIDYPITSTGLKPLAQSQLIDYWREGAAHVNYIGHGNYRLWSHEEAFEATGCVSRLDNEGKLPLMFSASCEVGLFYRTSGQCIAEQVILKEEGGAVASIAATRMTSAPSNGALNSGFLDRTWNSGGPIPVGDALLAAKGTSGYHSTAGQYVIFGDPAMPMGSPELDIRLQMDPDTLLAGRVIHVTGEVYRDSVFQSDFDGTAYIKAYDSSLMKRAESDILFGSISYYTPGNRLFSGPVEVTDGRLEADFVVPIDISYGTDSAKITAYAYSDSEEAAGALSELAVAGDTSFAIEDTTGPEITLSFEGKGYMSGAILGPSPDLLAEIEDESGINISGSPGHGIGLILDGDKAGKIDLAPHFEYNLGSYTRGALTYGLQNLSVGIHTLTVTAWDNMGNSSSEQIEFEVAGDETSISNLMASPNPFRRETDIVFNVTVPAEATAKIFTLSGRLVRELSASVSPALGVIHWDGRDKHGEPVANGAYIVKVEIRDSDGETASELAKIARLE